MSKLKGDKVIWTITFIFAALSIISVYSFIGNLAIQQRGGNTEYYLIKHGLITFTGFILMFYTHKLKFHYYSRLSQIGIVAAVVLLILTLMFGVSVNNADRWLEVPIIGQRFQTSDIAKLALIVYVARLLSINKDKLHLFKEGVVPVLIPIAVICGLILPQNFSTAAMLFGICFIMMFIGGVPVKYLMGTVAAAIVGFSLLLLLAKSSPELLPRIDTWANRIENFFKDKPDKDDAWQVDTAKIAIYNGDVFGKGPGNGELKHSLAQASSDFYFSSFVEEFGLIGGIGLIVLYLVFLFRTVKLGLKCEKRFGSMLVLGLGIGITVQAMINMGVSTNVLPVTGQNMPMLGLGGTSTWFTYISMGLILSVSRSVFKDTIEEKNNVNKEKNAVA